MMKPKILLMLRVSEYEHKRLYTALKNQGIEMDVWKGFLHISIGYFHLPENAFDNDFCSQIIDHIKKFYIGLYSWKVSGVKLHRKKETTFSYLTIENNTFLKNIRKICNSLQTRFPSFEARIQNPHITVCRYGEIHRETESIDLKIPDINIESLELVIRGKDNYDVCLDSEGNPYNVQYRIINIEKFNIETKYNHIPRFHKLLP